MSLTQILANTQFQSLRDLLKKTFPKPKQDKSIEIKAPPLTDNYSLVGTAFDYLIRFQVEFKFPHSEKREWVASKSFDIVKKRTESQFQFYSFYYRNKKVNNNEFYEIAKKLFQKAKSEYQKFLKTGYLNDDLYESVIILAQFEPIFRRNVFLPGFGEIDQKDIIDLKNLVEIIPENFFHVEKRCFLNPTFGIGSGLVFGADADLIIDDDLIDIKVTKEIDLKRPFFNQIIGYYFLSLIGGINGDKEKESVKNICVYFARYGYLFKLPISDFLNDNEIIQFKSEFLELILLTTKTITLKQTLNKVELFNYYIEEGYFSKEEITLLIQSSKSQNNKEKAVKHSISLKDKNKAIDLLVEQRKINLKELELGLITIKECRTKVKAIWEKITLLIQSSKLQNNKEKAVKHSISLKDKNKAIELLIDDLEKREDKLIDLVKNKLITKAEFKKQQTQNRKAIIELTRKLEKGGIFK